MLSIDDRPYRLCDGVSRRQWLRIGGLGALGLALPQLSAWRRASAAEAVARDPSFGRAKACIVLFFSGGPPQHETWDPKPEAPLEIRGGVGSIASRVPGFDVGELMPLTARLTDRIFAIRSMSTQDNAHSSSGYWMLTGRPHAPTNSENAPLGPPNDAPSFAALVEYASRRGAPPGAAVGRTLPASIVLPEHIWNTGGIPWPGQDGGFLGRGADPWLLTCHPHRDDFQVPGVTLPGEVPPLRYDARQSLLAQVNRHLDLLSQNAAVERWQRLSQQALDVIASPAGRRAFAIDDEPAPLRERYGHNRFGQSVLLARRLVEAGAGLVQVNWTREPDESAVNPMWDTHADNERRLRSVLMPTMDAAYATLLEDLAERGLLDETLVVWMGEFGRSPRINPQGGRDHWGYVFSLALAGAQTRGGQVYGASDPIGGHPKHHRLRPEDLTATILHSLGIDPALEVHDALGRPLPLSSGTVIRAATG